MDDDVTTLVEATTSADGLLADALVRGVSELAVKTESADESTAVYQRRPFELTALRKRLFKLAHDRGPHAKLAYRMLSAIEAQREHYGRPPSEPRHPDYESGKQWPMKEPDGD